MIYYLLLNNKFLFLFKLNSIIFIYMKINIFKKFNFNIKIKIERILKNEDVGFELDT